MSTSTKDCKEFRANHSMQDKCLNCFCDKSSHIVSTNSESLNEKSNVSDKMAPNQMTPSKQQVGGENNEEKGECLDCQTKDREIEKLKRELEMVQVERDLAREEHRALEREMDEMHDNFKEDESEQFEQIKQELDVALKNCKILQIRLNKCERQYGQMEQVKLNLERQVDELQQQQQIKSIGQQSNQLSNSTQHPFIQLSQDFVKLSSREYDQLLRDLNDTSERERDLQEQIKYSQEEAQLKSDRLQAIEVENEVLLSKVNKLTLANSRLRSGPISRNASLERMQSTSGGSPTNEVENNKQQQQQGNESHDLRSSSLINSLSGAELIQQNEQLKLALELAQSECERLRGKIVDLASQLDNSQNIIKDLENQKAELQSQLSRASGGHATNQLQRQRVGSGDNNNNDDNNNSTKAKLELECRQLRARLVHSERDCKQLRSQLEMLPGGGVVTGGKELSSQGSTSATAITRELQEEVGNLRRQKAELERKFRLVSSGSSGGNGNGKQNEASVTESDLLEKLKRQLDSSESELAKAKSRLVEMDLECGRATRQYRRLVASLESSGSESLESRKSKIPAESTREAMSRLELKQVIKDLELELEELVGAVKAKDCLLKEYMATIKGSVLPQSAAAATTRALGDNADGQLSTSSGSSAEEQLKSLRRLLDQERLLSNNLKLDVANLEQRKYESETRTRMLERERVAMEEELDKLRQVNMELNGNLEEQNKLLRSSLIKLKEVESNYKRVCGQLQQQQQVASGSKTSSSSSGQQELQQQQVHDSASSGDLLLMARNLSELKVKNGFLMRQLEIAREETTRQLDELRESCDAQLRRAVELAQLELKERHLNEIQSIKDELNEQKQKLAASQRSLTRAEEEIAQERDRLRTSERDFRRDKSQWQQKLEQLEAQQQIERRSNEFRIKEIESIVREKDRELLSFQDKYVQLERDFKRLQNKYNQLEEDHNSRIKNLFRELESKKRELQDLLETNRARESEYYENCNRFNAEKATLLEALESIKRSFNEKLTELKSTRELMLLRQEQSYKERQQSQDRIEQLSQQLISASEFESQNKLLRHQLAALEKQFEVAKRDSSQVKEERSKLRTRLGELEQRIHEYEKLELKSKTSSLTSGSGGSASNSSSTGGLFSKSPFRSNSTSRSSKQTTESSSTTKLTQPVDAKNNSDNNGTMEKLTSKIQDQRQLINLLRQQLAETQLELKQLKLLQAAEKNKWQCRVTLLTGRLNEAEEKLIFETSLGQLANQDTFEGARRKLEVKWAEERRSTLEMLQQAQTQNEIMTRDLKKISQSYDLLRLQSKQLESNNQKLSKKLIEYQQQMPNFNSKSSSSSSNRFHAQELELRQRLKQCEQLERANAKLMEIMKSEAVPLVEIVNKILQSLDELPATVSSSTGGAATPSSGFQSSQSTTPSLGGEPASLWRSSKSTMRPLRTATTSTTTSASNRRSSVAGDEAEISDESGAVDSIASMSMPISSAKPVHQTIGDSSTSGGQSRLSRLLTGSKSSAGKGSTQDSTTAISSPATSKSPVKLVKRVRVKCASLGITATEKKRLKSHLRELSSTLGNLNEFRVPPNSVPATSTTATGGASCSSNLTTTATSGSCLKTTSNHNHHSNDESESVSSRVHWQLDSDLDSLLDNNSGNNNTKTSTKAQKFIYTSNANGGNWSLGRSSSEQPSDRGKQPTQGLSFAGSNSSLVTGSGNATGTTSNIYRRFPQSTPSSYGGAAGGGGSLTDYESESSLASDFISSSGFGVPARDRLPSGAESDSCVTGTGGMSVGVVGGKARKRGLKSRLTSTLRNFSRSITGLASDSEDTPASDQSKYRIKSTAQTPTTTRSKTVEPEDLASLASGHSLHEIRV